MSGSDSEDYDTESDPDKELSEKYGGEFKTTVRKIEFTGDSQAMATLKDQLSRFADDPKMYEFLEAQRRRLVRQIHLLKKREDVADKNYEKRLYRIWWYKLWERSDEDRRDSFRRELADLKAKRERGEYLDPLFENFRLQFLDQLINFLDKEGDKEEIKEAWLNLGQRQMKTRSRQRAKQSKGAAGKLVDLRF